MGERVAALRQQLPADVVHRARPDCARYWRTPRGRITKQINTLRSKRRAKEARIAQLEGAPA